MSIKYIETIEEVKEIHRKTVEISGGGILGILNTSALESALEFIKDDRFYPTFEDKLTHLFFVANKSHSFQDGNKRIAISLGMRFLLDHGHLAVIQSFAHKMEIISLHLAASRIEKELLKEIITSIINEEDYSEELKLKIANAINDEV